MNTIEHYDIFLFDFEDSFTFNIASELVQMNLSVFVVPLDEAKLYLSKINDYCIDNNEKKVIILGPGPGHPDDYKSLYSQIRKVMALDNCFLLGICMGHQILWSILGAVVRKKEMPVHGQSVEVITPSWSIVFDEVFHNKKTSVQVYNSLCILEDSFNLVKSDTVFINRELMFGYNKRYNFLSYQFHPESVGTSYPYLFFSPIKKFLYNSTDEQRL